MKNRFLSLATAALCLLVPACAPSAQNDHTASSAHDPVHLVVFEADSLYTAWPAAARTVEGDILVLYTETDEHMGPDGRIVGVRSSDEGMTWSDPFLVYDTPLDERESGITVLGDGRLVVHLWSTRHTEESYGGMSPGSYYDHTVAAWVEEVNSASYAQAEALEGARAIMSSDGGRTWSEPVDGPDTIHGGIQLHDGSILVSSYRLSRDYVTVHKAESWEGPYRQIATVGANDSSVQTRPDSLRFGEPSILQLPSGRVIMMMRVTPKPYSDSDRRSVLWESYSDDNGETWVDPFPTPLWGFPPHLMLHSDGRVVVVYGRRIPPFGQRAAVSSDGITWREEDEIVLRNDAPNKDLGYPASVELEDGRVLTVYYQSHPSDTLRPPEGPPPDRHKPDIMGTVWRMPD
ncbi:MAG TPA: sialidase family protein [Rhodothermales bacterium]|nr:sialidase family protein [Rhodothermales bacterium]